MGVEAPLQRILCLVRNAVEALARSRAASVPSQESHGQQGHHLPSGEALLLGEIYAQNLPVRFHYQLRGVLALFTSLGWRRRKVIEQDGQVVFQSAVRALERRDPDRPRGHDGSGQRPAGHPALRIHGVHQESRPVPQENAG